MIITSHLRLHVVRPVLEYLDPVIPYSLTAENLLLGTCAVESDMGAFLVQNGGPALGIYQMEPLTHNDIYNNFFIYNPVIEKKVMDLITKVFSVNGMTPKDMTGNLLYATAMARVHYYRVSEPLPENTPEALGAYWKQHYNTPLGKGTVDKFVGKYYDYVK